MKSIWKYELPLDDNVRTIDMPEGARIVHVERQKLRGDDDFSRHLTFWAEVDPAAMPVRRRFKIVGTGHPYDEGEYVGTMLNGPLVFHLLELSKAGK